MPRHPRPARSFRRAAAIALPPLIACWLALGAYAESPPSSESNPLLESRVYLQISPRGTDELDALLTTLEDSVAADESQPDPVVVVLHGPEASRFLRRSYLDNQALVDRAAKLEAFDRIELRMCETWMRSNGVVREDLLPFVDTVPLAPEEVERLEQEGYLPFSAVRPNNPLL
jgi:intracellular sulfur oxidation DsrE/DsrF family protein